MFNPSCLRRSAILGAVACALLSGPTGAVAAAQPNDVQQCRVELGAGLPAVPCPDGAVASSPSVSPAQAQEDYYASYGEPEPIHASIAPAPTPDDTPWLAIALGTSAALAAASVAVVHRRRRRLQRRLARAAI
jgi:hypothetical protein